MNSPRLERLEEIEAAVWRELAAAARERGHEWRIGVLATTDGVSADARTVVLRELERDTRTLLIYTDSRSPKVQQIATHPSGTLVLWSGRLSWDLRLRVMLSVETAGLTVSSRWARLKMKPGAQDYLSPIPPGTLLDGPRPQVPPQRESREHFAVLAAEVQSVDWLELDAAGHRRALFDGRARRWMAP